MAILSAEIDVKIEPLKKAFIVVLDANGKFLASVGRRARSILKRDFLSGQELSYKTFGKGITDKRMITTDVNKRRTFVKIYSFPSNLFENGRTLRNGRREAPKKIITGKLKRVIMSNMGSYVSSFEKRILEPEIRKAGL